MVVGVVAMSTSVSDGQLANTPLANVLPLPVSVALVRAVHPAKVYSPTPYDEVVTEMSPVQPWKAFAPSDVTEAGMVTEERFLASRNALGNTFFTVEGMVNDLLVEVLGYFTKVVPALSYKTPPVLLKYLLRGGVDTSQGNHFLKDIRSDGCHGGGDGDDGERETAMESPVADGSHLGRDGDALQETASLKLTLADGRQASEILQFGETPYKVVATESPIERHHRCRLGLTQPSVAVFVPM